MGNGLIAFLISLGISMWIYSKFMRGTGGNVKNAVIGAATCGIVLFFFLLLLLSFLPD